MAKIYIDPGHNPTGADTGAAGFGHKEQDITVQIGRRVQDLLVQSGQTVYMSRRTEGDVIGDGSLTSSLQSRASQANSKGADIFVSIHCNAANTKAYGCETYSYPGSTQGKQLAKCIQNYLPQLTGRYDRGVKEANFAVLRNTNMPAVLVETAFIDNYDDSYYLASDTGQQSIAEAITKGICEYLGIDYKGGVTMENAKKFTDIEGHYAQKHIEKLAAYGIVNGDGTGKFNPDEPVTRADAAIMIANALTVCGK